MIVGTEKNKGMVSAITNIIKGLSKVGVWASVKANIISKNLKPVFSTISLFIDII